MSSIADSMGFQTAGRPSAPSSYDETLGGGILIRYDGLDAAEHEIELSGLAESLRGLSRIIAVTGNFALTEKYVQHMDAMAVRVVVRPPEAHCFELMAFFQWANQTSIIAGTISGLSVALITYVVRRAAGKREEMKLLKDSLDKAIRELGTRDQAQIDRLLTTIDKMADSLRPAVKQAVAPIGRTASTLTIGKPDRTEVVTIGQEDKDAILSDVEDDIGNEQVFDVLISELDLRTGSCQVSLGEDVDPRVSATITDPVVRNRNNAYALSFAAHSRIRVRAKAATREGDIVRLYISNTA